MIFHINSLRRYYERDAEQGDSNATQVDMIIEENNDNEGLMTGKASRAEQLCMSLIHI